GNELRSIVAAQHRRSAALDNEFFEVVDESVCRDGSFDESADAFAGVFIHDRADLECFALLTDIELEIYCPHHIGRVRRRRLDCGGAHSFASTTLWHSESFFTPQALNFLVIDVPSFAASIMVSTTISPAWVVCGVLAQPGTQRLVRISHGVVVQGSAPCRSGQPSQTACHTLTDRTRAQQVSNGSTASAWA